MYPHRERGGGKEGEVRVSGLVFHTVTAFVLVISSTPVVTAAEPKLDIVFTGVVVYKKADSTPLAYKVIAPASSRHLAYVRFSPADYDQSSTLPPMPTSCTKPTQQYVVLENEGLIIEPEDAVVDPLGLAPGMAMEKVVSLKDLAGANAIFDPDYDQPTPTPNKVATQFVMDRGSLQHVAERELKPWYWEFSEYSKFLFLYNKKDYCGKRLCGISGIRLTLKLKDERPIRLVSTRDRARMLVLKVKTGSTTSITIGNSRKKDIICKGTPKKKPDGDFAHQFMMVKGIKRECIPFAGADCVHAVPIDDRSRGGSDCVGAQWP